MREPVRCPKCRRWFPTQRNLEAHNWLEHLSEEEKKKLVAERQKKIKPMTDKDWADLQKGE